MAPQAVEKRRGSGRVMQGGPGREGATLAVTLAGGQHAGRDATPGGAGPGPSLELLRAALGMFRSAARRPSRSLGLARPKSGELGAVATGRRTPVTRRRPRPARCNR